MQIIDLSVPISEQTPVYPGDPKVVIEDAGVLDRDGFTDHKITVGTHVGTHIDAPQHMLAGGKALNQISVDQFVGPGKYVKIDATFDMATVTRAGIQKGDIVLFHTGRSDHYNEPSYFIDYPVMSREVADYLVGLEVKMVGVDTGSVDNQEGFPVHKILLSGSVLIIENLTNLAPLAGKQFSVYALPINLQIDGAPARVIAQVN